MKRRLADPHSRPNIVPRLGRRFGYQSALVLSSHCNARFYRLCRSALGVEFRIHRQLPELARGAFEGLEHYLSVAHLARATSTRKAA